MRKLQPFFTYYGGKHRTAGRYPTPLHDFIIEPFAGSAGYACSHYTHKCVLVDKDPIITEVWRYLINATEREILELPDIEGDIRNTNLHQEAKWLIGFWLNKGSAKPKNKPSSWMLGGTRPNSYWGPVIRDRIASQLSAIRHWEVYNTEYNTIPNHTCTWFLDPPYQTGGVYYTCSSKDINFTELGNWATSRMGQVIVCEAKGADWLPFTNLHTTRANPGAHGGKYSEEVIWTNQIL